MSYTVLWTDASLYFLLTLALLFSLWARRQAPLISAIQHIKQSRQGIITLTILLAFVSIGVLDSIHFKTSLIQHDHKGRQHAVTQVYSAFDWLIQPLGQRYEKTYSAPLATHLYSKSLVNSPSGGVQRIHLPLQHVDPVNIQTQLLKAFVFSAIILGLFVFYQRRQRGFRTVSLLNCLSLLSVVWLISSVTFLIGHYHLLGTDKIGQDILYQCLKSIRTGLVIGTLTTLVMLPFALLCGLLAGYFGGKIDDVIQYLYTTLSSIPGVLLIASAVLALQVLMSQHPDWFDSMTARADARLLALCVILGVTSWTSLCRLLRGECLKLREKEYVQAAKVLGVGSFKILWRHLLPNVVHIILMTVVLDFSGLVLAEAVLSYVGVGVDPATMSWGNMINSARLELAREPVVWWPLCGAFVFMFTLVLAANLFADVVRDAFDPKVKQQ